MAVACSGWAAGRCCSSPAWRSPAACGLVALLLAGLTGRRVRMRKRREYALYELHLSAHDEAKPQDLEDMVESIAKIVRAFATERARDGQPYVAIELICGDGPSGMEWSINVRCEPRLVNDLDGAINATYPDVRLGREHAERPAAARRRAARTRPRDAASQEAHAGCTR